MAVRVQLVLLASAFVAGSTPLHGEFLVCPTVFYVPSYL